MMPFVVERDASRFFSRRKKFSPPARYGASMDFETKSEAQTSASTSVEQVSAVTESAIREELKNVVDPEIGLDVVSLGLIYDVKIDGGHVDVVMTLTSPGCPVAGPFMASVQSAVSQIPGVTDCHVDLTFSPPWDPRTMASDEAKMMMGFYY
jgi:metal-sulfur cluster biosynthetic enzyme